MLSISANPRLTTLASSAGCAAKYGPGDLSRVLQPFADLELPPGLLVGLQTRDDAAVYQVSPELAIVLTVDFFTPIVDDPWTFGAIAAANAMSDVFAMGGEVLTALNIAGFPADFPAPAIGEIFAGALAKVREARGSISGGHTITSPEPIFGLSVTGSVAPDRVLTKAAARPGETLFLTKSLGVGVLSTAQKQDRCPPADHAAAVASMLTLNRTAAHAIRSFPDIRACTDVTGFGLLGHASEVAERSGVRLRIDAARVPVLAGALAAIEQGSVPGGLLRNRDYFASAASGVRIAADVPESLATLLYDPQTSGGLLFTVPGGSRDEVIETFAASDAPLHEIGQVEEGSGIDVVYGS